MKFMKHHRTFKIGKKTFFVTAERNRSWSRSGVGAESERSGVIISWSGSGVGASVFSKTGAWSGVGAELLSLERSWSGAGRN